MSNLPDLGDVAKILDAKTVKKVYADAIQPAAQEVGGIGSTLAKSLHLFLAPFQLAAAYQDRLVKLLDQVRNKVPPERQREAPANVAGPVFEAFRYCEDGSVFHEMYLNLLTTAIDSERQDEAHPEFADIIGAMSTSEGFFLWDLAQVQRIETKVREGELDTLRLVVEERLPSWKDMPLVGSHVAHLRALGLIDHTSLSINLDDTQVLVTEAYDGHTVSIWLTAFGDQFVRVCLPDKEAVAEARTRSQASGGTDSPSG
jgi:hypothetical protein